MKGERKRSRAVGVVGAACLIAVLAFFVVEEVSYVRARVDVRFRMVAVGLIAAVILVGACGELRGAVRLLRSDARSHARAALGGLLMALGELGLVCYLLGRQDNPFGWSWPSLLSGVLDWWWLAFLSGLWLKVQATSAARRGEHAGTDQAASPQTQGPADAVSARRSAALLCLLALVAAGVIVQLVALGQGNQWLLAIAPVCFLAAAAIAWLTGLGKPK